MRHFAGHFDGHGDAPIRKPLDAAIRQVFAAIKCCGHDYANFLAFSHRQLVKKGLEVRSRLLIYIGV